MHSYKRFIIPPLNRGAPFGRPCGTFPAGHPLGAGIWVPLSRIERRYREMSHSLIYRKKKFDTRLNNVWFILVLKQKNNYTYYITIIINICQSHNLFFKGL